MGIANIRMQQTQQGAKTGMVGLGSNKNVAGLKKADAAAILTAAKLNPSDMAKQGGSVSDRSGDISLAKVNSDQTATSINLNALNASEQALAGQGISKAAVAPTDESDRTARALDA